MQQENSNFLYKMEDQLKNGSLQLIDEDEDDFGDEDNEIGFDDVDGYEDGLNNYEYDLPNDLNPNRQ
ncbi:hypothetical protein Ddye_022839 [Dipteronia dyeriana]|uniref:Uncharacterized protein n=1 Tax=Dipteronia dyeriana TaxID=168575 RepID=A0AAD9TSF5_9ROSI|nr:hypothetical protein Ddye_022839 [Dipteronia dyeriana]